MAGVQFQANAPGAARAQLDQLTGPALPALVAAAGLDQCAGLQFGDEVGDRRLAQPAPGRQLRPGLRTVAAQEPDEQGEVRPADTGAVGRPVEERGHRGAPLRRETDRISVLVTTGLL